MFQLDGSIAPCSRGFFPRIKDTEMTLFLLQSTIHKLVTHQESNNTVTLKIHHVYYSKFSERLPPSWVSHGWSARLVWSHPWMLWIDIPQNCCWFSFGIIILIILYLLANWSESFGITFSETNSELTPEAMDGWNMTVSFWGVKRLIFRGKLAVSFREGIPNARHPCLSWLRTMSERELLVSHKGNGK